MSYPGKESENLFGLNSSGVLVATSATTYATRTIASGQGINVTNGDGVSGNITIASTIPTLTPGTYSNPGLTVNSDGYISAISGSPNPVAPTYRGSTTSGAFTGTSATLSLPSGTVAGDFVVFMSAGGNPTYPTASGNANNNGWTKVTYHGNYWYVIIYTKTITSSDITGGNIPVTAGASFLNYCSISTFASGAFIASLGLTPLPLSTSTPTLPADFTLGPTAGDISMNPNIFWLAQSSVRSTSNPGAQSLSPGTLIGSQYTNASGSHSTYYYSGFPSKTLPLFVMLHPSGGTSCGDAVVGILATS